MIDPKKLVEAGVHWGHITSRWCPRMASYIWGEKNKVHLIDVSKTARQLEEAAQFLEGLAAKGETVLWVGTKRPARETIKAAAEKVDMPYVNHRWVGGILSNFQQVKKSVTKLLHLEDIIANAEKFPLYTKKDLSVFQKLIDRLVKVVGGIRSLVWPVGAVVLVDVNKEQSALKEAAIMGVPVIAIVDTNGDPSLVDYPIPANDDTSSSIAVITDYLVAAIERGKARWKAEQKELQEKKKVARESQEKDSALASVQGADKSALVADDSGEDSDVADQPQRRKAAVKPTRKRVAASSERERKGGVRSSRRSLAGEAEVRPMRQKAKASTKKKESDKK